MKLSWYSRMWSCRRLKEAEALRHVQETDQKRHFQYTLDPVICKS